MSTPFDSATLSAVTQAILALASAIRDVGRANGSPAPPAIPHVDEDLSSQSTGTAPGILAINIATANMLLPPTVRLSPWYVVLRGRAPGVYLTVAEVDAQVKGVSNFASRRCGTQSEALFAYSEAWRRGEVKELVDEGEADGSEWVEATESTD